MPQSEQTILVVEDDAAVRKFLRSVLEASSFGVLTAESEEEAEKQWLAASPGISLLVTDFTLFGSTADRLIESFRKKNPNLPVIVISGYSREVIEGRGGLGAGVAFLEKPFHAGQFLEMVRKEIAEKGA